MMWGKSNMMWGQSNNSNMMWENLIWFGAYGTYGIRLIRCGTYGLGLIQESCMRNSGSFFLMRLWKIFEY